LGSEAEVELNKEYAALGKMDFSEATQ